MKLLTPIFVTLLLTTAAAQTRIGAVTLTTPTVSAPVLRQLPAAPMTPARQRVNTGTQNLPNQSPSRQGSGRQSALPAAVPAANVSSKGMVSAAVPAGFIEIRGRISAASSVTLPAGSTVSVSVNNLTRPAQVIGIQFKTSHLSTPYQMVFNGARLNGKDTYAVQATVTDASGKLLYSSDHAPLPRSSHAAVNLSVR